MRILNTNLIAFITALTISVATFGTVASAHVVVKPAEVVTAGFQTFNMGVPNEKDIATVKVKLLLPDGLQFVSPTQKAGWKIDVEKVGNGEEATIKSITWSDNTVNTGFRDDFTFSAKVPDQPTELQWKAYQTYSDGSVVSWDEAGNHEEEGGDSGPFSVTKVVSETQAEVSAKNTENLANDAQSTANTALYIAVAGVVVGFVGVFFATRKK